MFHGHYLEIKLGHTKKQIVCIFEKCELDMKT